jgi:hypothetical protein
MKDDLSWEAMREPLEGARRSEDKLIGVLLLSADWFLMKTSEFLIIGNRGASGSQSIFK